MGELLSQPRPEGVAEIICPKNGSERVNVALVYPPTPTVISPCSNSVECLHSRGRCGKCRGNNLPLRITESESKR
ncbi:hypothetical protein U0070_018972 [Myodes glareolus]|uniref:Uncharacterized protein n=1 Tax=Myodes glareolus TaxID=447135 RepID=A0AAW0IT86_MYOGA